MGLLIHAAINAIPYKLKGSFLCYIHIYVYVVPSGDNTRVSHVLARQINRIDSYFFKVCRSQNLRVSTSVLFSAGRTWTRRASDVFP